jgi:hypothetical protein
MNHLNAKEKIGDVYVIHFDKKYYHCLHYIGFTQIGINNRLYLHKTNRGAALLKAVNRAGIDYKITLCFKNVPQSFEFKLKRQKKASNICPLCKQRRL